MSNNYTTPFDEMFDYDHSGSLDSNEVAWRNIYIMDLVESENRSSDSYTHDDYDSDDELDLDDDFDSDVDEDY